ncbi:MAG: hypothetical protein O3A20_07400 [Planctomycetota bacterium]|nr:hypothetical protein [Planctomycetota bacterium]
MSERAAALMAFAFLEVLAGIVLRNETLAARGSAEAQMRREASCERRAQEHRSLYAWLASPEQRRIRERLNEQAGRAASSDPNRDL